MSVLIKGMEMPKDGDYLFSFASDENGRNPIVRIENCKTKELIRYEEIFEVPPHGRLIDADVLKEKQQADADLFIGSTDYGEKFRRDEALNAVANIVNAPTIIEAEGE